MSTHRDRLEALNIARADAGIAHCAKLFSHERVMRISPDSIDQDDDKDCIFARAAGMPYLGAIQQHPLTERQEVEFAFVGEFDMLAFDGTTKTSDLTAVVRSRLREYQLRHRIAA